MSQRDKNLPAKPLMPTLAQKRNVKSPITPRLATTATPPTIVKNGSTRSATTPGNSIRSPAGTRDELATPAKAFVNINNNITPRSGSRKSRVDSNQSTPTSTPNGSFSHIDTVSSGGKHTSFAGFGLGVGSQGNKSRPTSMVGMPKGALSPGSTLESRYRRPDSDGDGSMFFHASDVPRSTSPESRPDLRSMPSAAKSPVFLYANGQIDESLRPAAQPSPPLSSISTRSKKSQFFRADGRTDADVPPVPPVPSLPSPSAMNAPPQFFQAAPAFRPPSPDKEQQNFHLSYRKGASQIIRPPAERPKHISILPPNVSASGLAIRRRSLAKSPEQTSRDPRKRTSSLSSIESGVSVRRTSGTGFEGTGLSSLQAILQLPTDSSSSPSTVPSWPQTASPILERESLGDESTCSQSTRERQASPSSPILSMAPQSPTKSQTSFSNQMAESIRNSRVERKIQDLEISNSSLMAINKSLEKEMRRQNKELRRFRRLSRAGRLSTVSTMLSVGTNGEDEDDFSGELSALEELSEEEEEEPEESSDDSSQSDLASLSPEAIAEREERKLAKDSKRLQLDLAKHRDILVDSQKVNQSLRRCMAWTDMMIADGKKALDYKAENDVGGRILDHDELNEHHGEEDVEDEEQQRHGLLGSWSPSSNPMPHLEALDSLLGLDTSAITNPKATTAGATPRVPSEALRKADFWGITNTL